MNKKLVGAMLLSLSVISSADSANYSIKDAYNDGLAHGSAAPIAGTDSKNTIYGADLKKSRAAYHDCVLENIKSAHTRTAANAVKSACRGKHWSSEWDVKLLY
jgi:hypothetical protein